MATEMSPMLHRIQPAASGANGDETCLSRQFPATQTGISNVSAPPGRATLPLSRKPSRRLSIFPRPCRVPATTEPCPQLIAIWNHPAKQLRRSPSTGSGSSPAIRGLSGIWALCPMASSPSPRGGGIGEGLHSESPGIGAEPVGGPEPVGRCPV